MTNKNFHLFVSSIILPSIILFPLHANAGAWTQPKGDGQLIVTGSYSRTDTRFDDNGNKQSQPTYTKYEINPYLEYGITDKLTVGANLFLQHLNDSSDTTTGSGDVELFLRQRLWQNEHYVFSIQPLVKLPSPSSSSTHTPAIGSRNADLALHALIGRNFSMFGQGHYAELEAGYRYRMGDPNDQIVINATVGLNLTDRITVLPQIFQTIRMDDSTAAGFTQSPRDDYTLTKAQLSAVYKLSETRAVQAGVFKNVMGRNAGDGGGAMLSYWVKF